MTSRVNVTGGARETTLQCNVKSSWVDEGPQTCVAAKVHASAKSKYARAKSKYEKADGPVGGERRRKRTQHE